MILSNAVPLHDKFPLGQTLPDLSSQQDKPRFPIRQTFIPVKTKQSSQQDKPWLSKVPDRTNIYAVTC